MDDFPLQFALIIETKLDEVPNGLSDEILYLTVRKDVLSLLINTNTHIHYFGYAPDNTADNNDELLSDGIFYRIIGFEKKFRNRFRKLKK